MEENERWTSLMMFDNSLQNLQHIILNHDEV
jgi:hypothetical protein